MTSMMTGPTPDGADVMDAGALEWALNRMVPGLWTPGARPKETLADVRTRRAAALDILDDLLAEYADLVDEIAAEAAGDGDL